MPVGMFPDATFQERRVNVPAGSSIVVYTDGLSEALNAEGEEFGEERIMRYLISLPKPIDAEAICKHLAGRVAEWTGGADRFDDTTILALSVDAYNSNAAAATATTATPVNSPKEAILKERLRSSL
jgi:phosphoserine phosphatase RsbU/P